jgi:hypothetical protein
MVKVPVRAQRKGAGPDERYVMKTGQEPPATIEEYIAGFPRDVQPVLKRLRSTIRKAIPAAEEAISYGVLHTGKPASCGSQQDGKNWHLAMESEDFAATFTAAMDCRGVVLAQTIARAVDLGASRQLLDIGGG